MAIRVLVADDHALFRAGIRKLLQSFAGVEVVGEAADGHEALRLTAAQHPDVLLMDIGMPSLNGVDAAARLTRESARPRVIILSMHTGEEHVLRAIRAGAAGYLLKDATPAELETAVRAVARGETYLSPAISRYVVEDYVRRAGGEHGPLDRLTPRQREILQLIAEGNTTKAIAAKLGLSVKTVETHRAQLMERLDVRDLAALVRLAVRLGLVTSEP
ncbi:MAG TPA: response regulator transcription factor [Methylomirabilota bacterium]|nr:response regulator transcription factor [Methylomirabilota bacterium]